MDSFIDRLKVGSIESVGLRCLGLALLFLMHIQLSTKLSLEHYGLFSFTMSITTTLAFISTLGWPAALTRLVAEYNATRRWGMMKGALVRSHKTSLGLSFALSSLLFYLSIKMGNDSRSVSIYFAALLLPLMSLIALRRRIFMGLQNVKGSLIPDEIVLPFLMILGALSYDYFSISDALKLYILSTSFLFIVTLVWILKLLPFKFDSTQSIYDSKAWRALTLPLMLGGVSQVVLSQSGIFMLGFFDDLHGTAVFSASYRLAMFITFAMTAINSIGMPMLAAAVYQRDIRSLKSIYKKTQLWGFMGALPVFCVFMFMPDFFLSLFGVQYEDRSIVLRILGVGQFFNSAVGLAGSLLVVSGKHRYFAVSMTFTMFFCVLLMMVVVPMWGAAGTAAVYSGCLIVLSLMQYTEAKKTIVVLFRNSVVKEH